MVTYRTARLIVSVSIGVLVGVLTDTAASWPMVVAAVSGFGMALVLDFVKACPDKRMDD